MAALSSCSKIKEMDSSIIIFVGVIGLYTKDMMYWGSTLKSKEERARGSRS
jgi:hypothetical protein